MTGILASLSSTDILTILNGTNTVFVNKKVLQKGVKKVSTFNTQ